MIKLNETHSIRQFEKLIKRNSTKLFGDYMGAKSFINLKHTYLLLIEEFKDEDVDIIFRDDGFKLYSPNFKPFNIFIWSPEYDRYYLKPARILQEENILKSYKRKWIPQEFLHFNGNLFLYPKEYRAEKILWTPKSEWGFLVYRNEYVISHVRSFIEFNNNSSKNYNENSYRD